MANLRRKSFLYIHQREASGIPIPSIRPDLVISSKCQVFLPHLGAEMDRRPSRPSGLAPKGERWSQTEVLGMKASRGESISKFLFHFEGTRARYRSPWYVPQALLLYVHPQKEEPEG